MTDLVALKAANAQRWKAAKPTRNFGNVARALVSEMAKRRYQIVESRTGVPWWFIALVHERESSQNFTKSLAQGDPLDRVSTHVPAGRGPFLGLSAWEDAAVDALINCAPFAARNTDWSPGGTMTMAERYNGLAYANAGVPSPYVWSGTDQYVRGKVVRDHGPIEPIVDQQLGVAGLLMAMMALDKSISLAPSKPLTPPRPTPAPAPSVTTPAKGSIGAFIASIFAALFGRK